MFTEGHRKNLGVVRRQASRRPIPFVVFGNQRTGSTLIATKLTSHPRIVCYEEVFLPWVDSSPSLRDWLDAAGRPQWLRAVPGVRASFLDVLFDADSVPGDVGAVGFKVMYNQLSLWPTFAYLTPRGGRLLQDRSLRNWLSVNEVIIIHTLRRNRLKVLVSHELAAQSGRYHSRDSESENRRVAIPLLGLKARLRRIETAERYVLLSEGYRRSRSSMRITSALGVLTRTVAYALRWASPFWRAACHRRSVRYQVMTCAILWRTMTKSLLTCRELVLSAS